MNMKKNIFNWMLAVALMCGLGIIVTSCSDDDDESIEERQEREARQKASNFWNVVGQLVSVDDVTDDYEGKTFEPTIGMPDATNATTRIVNTNDMQTAAQRFANLVDAKGINENTASYTWSDPEIGSMTYTKGGDPSNWATVDVDIKAVPGLQRIIYREGGAGENGKFKGRAYYRFGDVVSREVKTTSERIQGQGDFDDSITEYWICVRPAFGPEGKEDSHWVCVNTVSDKNYKYYHSSNGANYWLPTKLGTDKENMQNFAELLYAICKPTTWHENVENKHTDGRLWGFDGVPFFTDFKKANLHLHNERFWKNVQEAWKEKQVVQKALNLDNIEELNKVVNDGVRLLYNGYSWWFTTSWNCELWEAVYTSGTKDEELNMHHVEYNNPEKNMKSVNFDVRVMGKKTDNYNGYFGDSKTRWAIRHATGKELASDKKYDVKKPINGVKEEYRYYGDVFYDTSLNGDPESTPAPQTELMNAPTNAGLYMIGDVVEDYAGNRWFCIAGSPKGLLYPNAPNQLATFISFDGINEKSSTPDEIINEEQLMDVAIKLAIMYNQLASSQDHLGKFSQQELGIIGEHILNYTGVDLRKIFMVRDSVWEFTNYRSKINYKSPSHSAFFNLAYYRSGDNRQAIARFIADVTQAGDKRDACQGISATIQDWQYRVYKHYEVFDTSRMEGRPNENEISVGMTKWQARWPMSDDKMYLDDVANQQMINKYAAADKWVRLQQETPDGTVPGGPRTKPESSARPEDYLWKKTDFATKKTSIFNEPVLFLRVMYVEDPGGKMPNLTATDGTKLKIVHMQDNKNLYLGFVQMYWGSIMYLNINGKPTLWLDNELYKIEGWPKPQY